MFIGEYIYNLDEKKRLSIPAKFRRLLGQKAILTKGLEECLFLYPQKEWQKLVEKLERLPLAQKEARGFARLILAGATEVEIDSLGRILIPDFLKDYAKLKKKVVVAGLLTRIEIWDEEIWKGYKERTEKEIGDISEKLSQLI